jgi:hypothetical protein
MEAQVDKNDTADAHPMGGFVQIRGAREHNLKDVSLEIPRNALAVALQQQRGSPTIRSSVGSVTTLSNLLRMLYSCAGDYSPRSIAPLLGDNFAKVRAACCLPVSRPIQFDRRRQHCDPPLGRFPGGMV